MKDVPLGLLAYPVLQTADILIHRANEVPIGEDNLQQLHYAQHMAQKFNNKHKTTLFPIPKAVLSENPHAVRIRSLRSPDKKMSKSEPDAKGRIMVLDSPDEIRNKLKKAVTDCTSQISFDPENRPGVSNLILIHNLITGTPVEDICEENKHLQSADYKMILADIVIEFLRPIREKADELIKDEDEVRHRLKIGSQKAAERAEKTMVQVRKLIGTHI
jgi:tryptophanyl-tRNA synthetase